MTIFSVDDKLSAVKRYLEGGETYATTGVSIGTSENMVRTWVTQLSF